MVTSEYFLGQVCIRNQNHLYSNLVDSYKLLIQGHFTLLVWNTFIYYYIYIIPFILI